MATDQPVPGCHEAVTGKILPSPPPPYKYYPDFNFASVISPYNNYMDSDYAKSLSLNPSVSPAIL